MIKTRFVIAVAIIVAAAISFSPERVNAQSHHHGGNSFEAGVAGGVAGAAAGAIAVEALKNSGSGQPAPTPGVPGANYTPQDDAATSGFARQICHVEERGNRRVETCE